MTSRLSRTSPLSAIDLFSGAGGFTLAAQKSEIRVLAALEANSHACKTYAANFIIGKSEPPILLEQDIMTITPKEFADKANTPPGSLDIIMGGPPCQGYSTHRLNDSGVKDPRNDLLIRYFDFVRYLRPRAFIVENVPGMLWPRHEDYISTFYAEAYLSGYELSQPVVLNAKDFGVPQNRKRVFILGLNASLPADMWPPCPTHFAPDSTVVTEHRMKKWPTASVVFEKPLQPEDPNSIHMNHSAKLVEVFNSTPKNGGSRHQSNRVLPCHLSHDGHKDVYGRIDPTKPGPTMTTACTNPSKGRFVHPTENHGITVRHAARFQTFPDSFIFSGGLMEASRQVGNAVPIVLGEAVLKQIVKILDSI